MAKVRDLTGQRFTRLLVLSRVENSRAGKARWLCQCDCGEQSVAFSCNLRKGHTRSCGCLWVESITKAPIALRFWDSVNVGDPDECWEWQALIDRRGYGRIFVAGEVKKAHRIAWSLRHGREPDLQILHHCDNPACCNPAHLYEGTQADNSRDKVQAGRYRNGSTGPMTPEEEFATRGFRPCTG